MGNGHSSVLSMETADMPVIGRIVLPERVVVAPATIPKGEAVPEQAPRHERVRLTPEQQKAFDRAFRKREAKVRAESAAMLKDLLDTCEVTHQLLGICSDRISVADQRAIRTELNDIRLAYGGTKQWPKK
jgi:hypothetical protein